MSLELNDFKIEEIPTLAKWVSSPELHERWTGRFFRYPLEARQIEFYLAEASLPNAQHQIFAIRHSEQGLIGYAELSHIWPHLSARISRLLIGPPELRGRGYGAQATEILLKIAFERFHVHRVDLGVLEENRAAIKTYKNVGFKQVGLWSDFPGSSDNLVWMSLESSTYQSQKP